MALAKGSHLGSYEILSAIGAGGMGEVYRARDTKLDRDVAIKVLPESFANDPERLARFEREAKTLAALNHPHIAHVYGLEHEGALRALVMELVEGEDLSQRIVRGPIPLDEALPIARQIAEALEAAHEQGIIHRDLKPANIKVRPDGTVKVLDFGLAKALDPVGQDFSPAATQSPTITSPALMTGVGMILGTAAYMAPEQARGKVLDKRADIWAFGCVLFEMLTGRRAFEGEDITETLAAVVKSEPDWGALPSTTPPGLRRLVTRCLKKDPKARLRDIGEARLQIEELGSAPEEAAAVATSRTLPLWRRALPWSVAAVALIVGVAVVTLWAPWREAAPVAPLRLSAEVGADASLVTSREDAAMALSPDGSRIAFVAQKDSAANPQLYVRSLDELQANALPGTEGAHHPFFSPDGQSIAFFAGGKLKKISVNGGAAVTLCDVAADRGGAWAADGTIVFSPVAVVGVPARGALFRVSSAGGDAEPLTTLGDGEVTQRTPQMLPGGKAVLYTGHNNTTGFETANIVVQPLPSGPRKVLVRGGYHGRYLASGHLVYIHEATLFAAPFDVERLELIGEAVPVLENVAAEPDTGNAGGAQFAASDNGTLVYVPGRGVGNDAVIAWMNREGRTTPLRATPANWADPHFAPNGRQLAVYINDGRQSDVWTYEWERDTLSRLTSDLADDRHPAWAPDGRRIAFASSRADKLTFNLYWQRADGTGEAQRLTESKNNQFGASWHPSGRFLAFRETNPQTGSDLMILPIEGDEASGWKPGQPTVFLNGLVNEAWPSFSPDGRWLAYQSNESERFEIYVRPFPGPGGRSLISSGGGTLPAWSRTRQELFYETPPPDNRIMVASYAVEGDLFLPEKPRLWADRRFMVRPQGRDFDLHPDGERVALEPELETAVAPKQDKVVFIFNFFDELKRLAPTTK